MALVIKEVSSNTVTEVGNVIIIEGGGLTPAQSDKLDNVPLDTITELANKVDKSGTKVLSDFNFNSTYKGQLDNAPSNINTSFDGKVDKVGGKGLSTNDFNNTYKGQLDNAPSDINASFAAKADLVAGKVPTDQLPDLSTGALVYQGLWNATTNTPSISDATGTNLYYYKVSVAGSQDLGNGSISFAIGDWAIHNGSIWEKLDQSETVTSVNSQVGNVSITPTSLGLGNVENKSSSTIRSEIVESDIPAEIARTADITLTSLGIPNVENKSSATIRSEITETDIPVEIARTTAIPITTTPLTDTSAKRFVTDTEKETWNGKAEPGDFAAAISITGTHDETTTAINFSTNQGYAITLTANRSFTVSTGLSASNPIGILKITHAGFTPSFSGVTALDSALDKSGVYYLKFTRQPDGTITQSNQSGGGASTLAELDTSVTGAQLDTIKTTVDSIGEVRKTISSVWTSANILIGNATPLTLKTAGGTGILDRVVDAWGYLDYKTAYTGNTQVDLISGSTTIGTLDVLGQTSSGWYPFTLSGTPETNAALTAKVNTGNPTGGTSNLGLLVSYHSKPSSVFTFPSSEIMYDDFPTGAISTSKWDETNANASVLTWGQTGDQLVASIIASGTTSVTGNNLLSIDTASSTCSVALDFVSNSRAGTAYSAALELYFDDNNRVTLFEANDGSTLMYIRVGGSVVRSFAETGITFTGKRWKITRDAANRFRFYYYNSGWVELRSSTDYTENIGTNVKARIIAWVHTSVGTGSIVFDRFRFDSDTYSSELP